jgi:phosphohistidine swiveling domain-containing protein
LEIEINLAMNWILTTDQLKAHSQEVGAKALNLERLQSIGCHVPPFIVIPSSAIRKIDEDSIKHIVNEIVTILHNVSSFSVRSAMRIEDDFKQSHAGQFLTRLNISEPDLAAAIIEVVSHADARLNRDLSNCSIIVQEYIPADYSGVTFTRHPSCFRQMLIEYHAGVGEHLVSGAIRPASIEIFWTEPLPSHELPLPSMIDVFELVEQTFHYPQDIEWCIRGNEFFLLQSRPITTINDTQYAGLLYLDQKLPSEIPFRYEQTAICEIAPRPTPFTFSILKRLYEKNGPIDRVYQSHGVHYESKDFLKVIGNQLYIDREQELHSLFPTHTYYRMPYSEKPRFNSLAECIRSIRNFFAFATMKAKTIHEYEHRLNDLLEKIPQSTDPSTTWTFFNHAYETIFEVNLFAEQYISRLEFALKAHHISSISILSSSFRTRFFQPAFSIQPKSWIGNGLETIEQEAFIAKNPVYQKNEILDTWWTALPEYQQKILSPILMHAIAFDDLRERGRWLTVGYMNAFRTSTISWSPFITIDEYETRTTDISVKDREQAYAQYSEWDFPSLLTNLDVSGLSKTLKGVSSGNANGILVTREQLDEYPNESLILYSEMLTPDLVQFFPRIKGILSVQGGTLSHLAILAREHHVPVVVNIDLLKEGLHLGDKLHIDGDLGIVSKLAPV